MRGKWMERRGLEEEVGEEENERGDKM